jgi:hypothetical protein
MESSYFLGNGSVARARIPVSLKIFHNGLGPTMLYVRCLLFVPWMGYRKLPRLGGPCMYVPSTAIRNFVLFVSLAFFPTIRFSFAFSSTFLFFCFRYCFCICFCMLLFLSIFFSFLFQFILFLPFLSSNSF